MDHPHADYPEAAIQAVSRPTPSRLGLLFQVWTYTGIVALVVGGIVSVLTSQPLLLWPIGILCLLVGITGSLLAILRTMPGAEAGPTGIFR
jgi:hypothetical protein